MSCSPESSAAPQDAEAVLSFWFSAPMREHWFRSKPELDRQIRDRFENLWQRAARGELQAWEQHPAGALALVIVLDQLPLNMYRDQARSFATEASAREVAARALEKGFDRHLNGEQQAFLFMPFMHSEQIDDQDRAVALYQAAGLEHNLKWARHHRELIRRFGRFPHRNAILGRADTAAEQTYLQSEEAFLG